MIDTKKNILHTTNYIFKDYYPLYSWYTLIYNRVQQFVRILNQVHQSS